MVSVVVLLFGTVSPLHTQRPSNLASDLPSDVSTVKVFGIVTTVELPTGYEALHAKSVVLLQRILFWLSVIVALIILAPVSRKESLAVAVPTGGVVGEVVPVPKGLVGVAVVVVVVVVGAVVVGAVVGVGAVGETGKGSEPSLSPNALLPPVGSVGAIGAGSSPGLISVAGLRESVTGWAAGLHDTTKNKEITCNIFFMILNRLNALFA